MTTPNQLEPNTPDYQYRKDLKATKACACCIRTTLDFCGAQTTLGGIVEAEGRVCWNDEPNQSNNMLTIFVSGGGR
jgi:hypothetical protein